MKYELHLSDVTDIVRSVLIMSFVYNIAGFLDTHINIEKMLIFKLDNYPESRYDIRYIGTI